MKTTTKLLSVILCMVAVLCIAATNAFAVEVGDVIDWTYYFEDGDSNTVTAEYAGELEKDKIETVAKGDNVFYSIEAENSGYYFTEGINLICSNFDSAGKSYYSSKYDRGWFNSENSKFGDVFYLEKGRYIAYISNEYSDYERDVSVEYLGEIRDVVIKDNIDCMILGEDLYYEELKDYFWAYLGYEIEFSTGKALKNDPEISTLLYFDKLNLNGKTQVEISFMNYKKAFNIGVYEITEFVDYIEVEGCEPYLTTTEYYNGNLKADYEPDFGEEKAESVTVYFTDGTSKTIEYYLGECEWCEYITLPNGKKCSLYVGYRYDCFGNCSFVAQMGDVNFIGEALNIERASYVENLAYLTALVADRAYGYIEADYFMWCIENMVNPDAYYEPSRYFEFIFVNWYSSSICDEISMFAEYYSLF